MHDITRAARASLIVAAVATFLAAAGYTQATAALAIDHTATAGTTNSPGDRQIGIGRKQTVKVKGKFIVGTRPSTAAETTVRLVDKDTGLDDEMARAAINDDGTFMLEGTTTELTTIDPFLIVYTDADDGIVPCRRKVQYRIPDRYINATATFDLGVVQLEARIDPPEERDCL